MNSRFAENFVFQSIYLLLKSIVIDLKIFLIPIQLYIKITILYSNTIAKRQSHKKIM